MIKEIKNFEVIKSKITIIVILIKALTKIIVIVLFIIVIVLFIIVVISYSPELETEHGINH